MKLVSKVRQGDRGARRETAPNALLPLLEISKIILLLVDVCVECVVQRDDRDDEEEKDVHSFRQRRHTYQLCVAHQALE